MTEHRAPYATAQIEQPAYVPDDLWNLYHRVLKLRRGRVYNVILNVPERESEPLTWAFVGEGKVENGR